jgi:hypothetical protein
MGDVVFRYLPEYQVWHAGIVYRVNEDLPDNSHFVYLLEFDDSDQISQVSLYNFLWNRKYFWVTTFQDERELFGDSVFRTTRDKMATAYELFRSNQLKYTLHKYNCEYFVRRCTFKDSRLWASTQTAPYGQSRLALYTKLVSIVVFGMMNKMIGDVEYEKNMREKDIAYFAVDGKYQLV